MFYTDEQYIPGKGVFFIVEDDGGKPRHFLLDIAVLEKLSGKQNIQSPETSGLSFLYHYRNQIHRMCSVAFKETPAWSNERPYPLTLSHMSK
jgi:hypothetical protein